LSPSEFSMFTQLLELLKSVWRVVLYLFKIILFLAAGGLITCFWVLDDCIWCIELSNDSFLDKVWLEFVEVIMTSSIFSRSRFMRLDDCNCPTVEFDCSVSETVSKLLLVKMDVIFMTHKFMRAIIKSKNACMSFDVVSSILS